MTDDDRNKLRALAMAATPGEWKAVEANHDDVDAPWTHGWYLWSAVKGVIGYWTGGKSHHTSRRWYLSKEDAAYITAANPKSMIALLDQIDGLEARNKRMEKALNWYDQQCQLARLIGGDSHKVRLAFAEDGGRIARKALEANK